MSSRTAHSRPPKGNVVALALHVSSADGASWVVRGRLAEAEFDGIVDDVLASFRAMSTERGMRMTDAEIRRDCWAPMLAKLVDGPLSEVGETFKDRTLCFLAWVGFGAGVRAGDTIDIYVGDNRMTTIFRRPQRILRPNRRCLGRLASLVG